MRLSAELIKTVEVLLLQKQLLLENLKTFCNLTHGAFHKYVSNYWVLNATKFRGYCQQVS